MIGRFTLPLLFILTISASLDAEMIQSHNAEIITSNLIPKPQAIISAPITPKMLQSREVKLLNGNLKSKPHVTVRMEFSLKFAEKTLQNIREQQAAHHKFTHDETKSTIKLELQKILDPVKSFFNEIKAHASILRPLIQESLAGLAAARHMQASSLYFMQFFENPERDASAFLESKIITIEDLKLFCEELITFIGDILQTRTAAMIKNHNDLMKDVVLQQLTSQHATKDHQAKVPQDFPKTSNL